MEEMTNGLGTMRRSSKQYVSSISRRLIDKRRGKKYFSLTFSVADTRGENPRDEEKNDACNQPEHRSAKVPWRAEREVPERSYKEKETTITSKRTEVIQSVTQ